MAPAQGGSSLGDHLRALRSSAGGSLAEMAVTTRISESYLRSLESGVRDDLPAPVFVKGFIRAYCAFLGAPADEALGLYDQERGAPPMGESRAVRVRPPKSWIGHPLAISSALLLIFGVGLLALTLASQPPPTPTRSGERKATVRAPESAPETAPPAARAVSVPPAAEPAVAQAGVPETQRLVVKAVESTWIRVQIDDGRVVEELLKAGAQREWTSDRRFVLTIGNAGGIEIVLNGRPLPSLGARGAVIHRLSLPELPGQGS
jgi:cytoskeleton protein RodZ